MLEKVNDSRNKVFERILPESVEIVTKTPARPCLRPKAFDNLCIDKTNNYLIIQRKSSPEGIVPLTNSLKSLVKFETDRSETSGSKILTNKYCN